MDVNPDSAKVGEDTDKSVKIKVNKNDITVTFYYKKQSSGGGNCKMHYYSSYVNCEKYTTSDPWIDINGTCDAKCKGTPTYGSHNDNGTMRTMKQCHDCVLTDAQSKGAIQSALGSHSSSSKAVEDCGIAAKKKCTSDRTAVYNCKAVVDYDCQGYNLSTKNTDRETKHNQSSDPTASWCVGKTDCKCECLDK